ncbi:hypothetical protein CapIbe_010179 [Capra ibex]
MPLEGLPATAFSATRSTRPDVGVASLKLLGFNPSALSKHGGAGTGRGRDSAVTRPGVAGPALPWRPDPRVEIGQKRSDADLGKNYKTFLVLAEPWRDQALSLRSAPDTQLLQAALLHSRDCSSSSPRTTSLGGGGEL